MSKALQHVVDALSSEELQVAIDQDTRGSTGSVTIDHVILDKIARADAVVCDLTIVGWPDARDKPQSKGLPNPNVMFEAGYAFATVGPERVVLVKHNEPAGELPFDVRQRRRIDFDTVAELKIALAAAVAGIIGLGSPVPGTAEQRATIVRLLADRGSDARSRLSVELDLLATEPNDMWRRLAAYFRGSAPQNWKREWHYGSNPGQALRSDLRIALLPSSRADERDRALDNVSRYLAGVERLDRCRALVSEIGDWAPRPNYASGGHYTNAAKLQAGRDWLQKATELGFDTTRAREAWTEMQSRESRNRIAAVKEYAQEVHALNTQIENTDPCGVPGSLP